MKDNERSISLEGKVEYKSIILALFIIAMIVLLTACTGNMQYSINTKGSNIMSDSTKIDNSGIEAKQLENIKNDFSLKDSKGNLFTLSTEKGKKIYIKFWATWCPICLAGIDELSKLNQDKSKDMDTEIVTIVSPGVKGEMNSDKFIKWFDKQGYKFKVLLDEGGNVARQFGVRGYPTSVFIDTKGEIAKTNVGHIGNSAIDSTISLMN